MEKLILLGDQACQLLDWKLHHWFACFLGSSDPDLNYTVSSPGSPACWRRVMGLLSLQITFTFTLYLHLLPWLSISAQWESISPQAVQISWVRSAITAYCMHLSISTLLVLFLWRILDNIEAKNHLNPTKAFVNSRAFLWAVETLSIQ